MIENQKKLTIAKTVSVSLIGMLCVAFACSEAEAFSLLGPYAPWMVPQIGYAQPGDIGGPMNLGEEYRWNVPVLTYAYDQSFINYFGQDGVAAVESAIALLNNVPNASELDPTNYPTTADRVNYRAQAEGLIDLKSQTLALLLEQLGLASPTRFTYCLHNFSIVNGTPQAVVIERNFDPALLRPTNEVDGVSYTYNLNYLPGPPAVADAVESLIDPLQTMSPAVADGALNPGGLYLNLTTDDVGGMRYLLNTNNLNFEALLPDVHGAGTNAGAYVDQALRPGIDKITFVRPGNYDSLMGRFTRPYTNQFFSTYVTNGIVLQEQLERVVSQPDIVFSSTDLSGGGTPAPRFTRTGTGNWLLSDASFGAAGPGVIRPPVRIVFHRPGSLLRTADVPNGATIAITDFEDWRWGSFDQSSNAPAIYPESSQTAAPSPLIVQLQLNFANRASPAVFQWQLPIALGAQANIETSTDFVHWTPVLLIVNRGVTLNWTHQAAQSARYFRVVGA